MSVQFSYVALFALLRLSLLSNTPFTRRSTHEALIKRAYQACLILKAYMKRTWSPFRATLEQTLSKLRAHVVHSKSWLDNGLYWVSVLHCVLPRVRLSSHKYKYKSGTVRVPVYEFRQTWVCVYFNGSRSHTYEYGLPVNFTRTSSFYAGRVFIQLVESKLLVNSINIIYKNCGIYLTSELTSS